MKARVHVRLKAGVLDPQGKAIGNALKSLGFGGVDGVRQGKLIELDLADTDPAAARARGGDVPAIAGQSGHRGLRNRARLNLPPDEFRILPELTLNLMGMPPPQRQFAAGKSRARRGPMLHLFLLRSATWILSAMLGGFGMFCLFYSFSTPRLLIHAAVLLVTATALVGFSPR